MVHKVYIVIAPSYDEFKKTCDRHIPATNPNFDIEWIKERGEFEHWIYKCKRKGWVIHPLLSKNYRNTPLGRSSELQWGLMKAHGIS